MLKAIEGVTINILLIESEANFRDRLGFSCPKRRRTSFPLENSVLQMGLIRSRVIPYPVVLPSSLQTIYNS